MLINCSVCLGDIDLLDKQVSITNCGHFFHSQCLHDWLAQQSNCPECRTIVTRGNFASNIFPKINHDKMKSLEDKCGKLQSEVLEKEKECETVQKINQEILSRLKSLEDRCDGFQNEIFLLKISNSAMNESKLIV